MTSTVEVTCERCKKPFMARVADRARGWGRFCSKNCKATKPAGQKAKPKKRKYPRHDGKSPMRTKFCEVCGERAINGVYTITGIAWGCARHLDTEHCFSSDALGQW